MKNQPTDPTPPWLRTLDHTADTGIIVRADDLRELFARAAWGLFAVITNPETVEPRRAIPISVGPGDLPGMLVRWLAELNYCHVTRRELYSRFEVRELSESGLAAQAWGEPIDPKRHPLHTEVKAVTYHGLQLTKLGRGWQAQVVFDL